MASRASTAAGKRRASARTSRAASAKRKPAKRSAAQGGRRPPSRAPAKRGSAGSRKRAKQAPARSGSSRRGNGNGHRRARTTAKTRRPAARPSSRRRPSARVALVVIAVVAIAGTAGYFGWLRDSSLVAVEQVRVKGVTTADGDRIDAALTKAATSMTTLNFDEQKLRSAVDSFPTVAAVSADPDFPRGVEITVTPRPPALIVESGGEAVPVAGDGTVLRGLAPADAGELPAIQLRTLPAAGRLGGEPLAQATIAGGAPGPLRPLIEEISYDAERGVEVLMKGEVPIRFGTPGAAEAKWAAAAAVLADPRLKSLTYIDVRVPERPSVGGAGPAVSEEAVAPTVPPTVTGAVADPAAPVPPPETEVVGP